ncbi:dipeptidase [Lapillicoccus jejuensis]|uniref:Acetylornithine deacetylase/succinyl-diaminopimelate desuccinylase-like protein n=1 Tax=Lapillicoccus jejuensis TaxID=402171 RepID=A0A542E5Y2_9MICO|nr:dipeptidase [Lapillicoccus jejuensis]TQJ10733.1 acetylornithine deacetylase/succinyl-diaminopimelate desuccinylase-like protein [Lapillicoccus jejuensis]
MSEDLAGVVAGLMGRAREDLAALVAWASVHDGQHAEACAEAAAAVVALLREVGVDDARTVPTDDGSAAVVGSVAGPPGAPTVLLYSHYDVQPPGDLDDWRDDPWTLTEHDGRWYGRGSADCKGNLVMHLTALRALREADPGGVPVGLRVVCEGSEEASTGGLERLLAADPSLFAADVVVVADAGNVALGTPTVTTSLRGTGSVLVTLRTLAGPVHSGALGGPAPDALAAMVRLLGTLRDDDGETTVDGLDADGRWDGAPYDVARFRADAGVLPGVGLLGRGEPADLVWARPVATVLALDAPPVAGVTAAIQGQARAVVNLRVPPGTDAAAAQRLLVAHLERRAPWGAQVQVQPMTLGRPFAARTDGPALRALEDAMREAYGVDAVHAGQGGSIPLTTALAEVLPGAEVLVCGVEEPACRIHSPGESVHPDELRRAALAEALFLRRLGGTEEAAQDAAAGVTR